MEPFGILFLKTNLAIALFTIFYRLLLKKFTFYHWNRWYLLFALLFSLIYPFIEITQLQFKQLQQIPSIIPQLVNQSQDLFSENIWKVLLTVWSIGFVWLLFKLFTQFISLWNIHRASKPSQNYKHLRIVQKPISPFSFGSNIYINPSMHSMEELEAILVHESIHVKQKHSFDIMLAEWVFMLNWLNPFVWMLKKSIKENIEFITDEDVLKKGVDKKEYQYFLLNVSQFSAQLQVQNNFSMNDLKKRILQMNMKKTSSVKLFLYIFIPVMALGLILINQPTQNSISYNLTNNTQDPTIQTLPSQQELPEQNNLEEHLDFDIPPPPKQARKVNIKDVQSKDIQSISVDQDNKQIIIHVKGEDGQIIDLPLTNDETPAIKLRGVPSRNQHTIDIKTINNTVEGRRIDPSNLVENEQVVNQVMNDPNSQSIPIVLRGVEMNPSSQKSTDQNVIEVVGQKSASLTNNGSNNSNTPIIVRGVQVKPHSKETTKDQGEIVVNGYQKKSN